MKKSSDLNRNFWDGRFSRRIVRSPISIQQFRGGLFLALRILVIGDLAGRRLILECRKECVCLVLKSKGGLCFVRSVLKRRC